MKYHEASWQIMKHHETTLQLLQIELPTPPEMTKRGDFNMYSLLLPWTAFHFSQCWAKSKPLPTTPPQDTMDPTLKPEKIEIL